MRTAIGAGAVIGTATGAAIGAAIGAAMASGACTMYPPALPAPSKPLMIPSRVRASNWPAATLGSVLTMNGYTTAPSLVWTQNSVSSSSGSAEESELDELDELDEPRRPLPLPLPLPLPPLPRPPPPPPRGLRMMPRCHPITTPEPRADTGARSAAALAHRISTSRSRWLSPGAGSNRLERILATRDRADLHKAVLFLLGTRPSFAMISSSASTSPAAILPASPRKYLWCRPARLALIPRP